MASNENKNKSFEFYPYENFPYYERRRERREREEEEREEEFLLILLHACNRQDKSEVLKYSRLISNFNIDYENNETPLHIVCENGNEEILKILIDKGIPLNLNRSSDGLTALQILSIKENFSMIKLFLERSQEISIQNLSRALIMSCKKGNEEIVRELLAVIFSLQDGQDLSSLKSKALHTAARYSSNKSLVEFLVLNQFDPEIRNLEGNNSLHLSCLNDDVPTVDFLIDKVDVMATNNVGNTPLHIACERDNMEMVKCLLEKCSYVPIRNLDNETAIDLSTSLDIRTYLIKNFITMRNVCASLDSRIHDCIFEDKKNLLFEDESGINSLHMACEFQNVDLVKFLLSKSVQINIKRKENEWTHIGPLHIACRNGNLEIVELLFDWMEQNQLKIDTQYRDSKGMTALHLACSHGSNRSVVDLLIQKGFDPNYLTPDGNNSLHLACLNNDLISARFLIEKVKDINQVNKDKNSAIHLACLTNDFYLVTTIMSKQPSLVSRNKNGMKPNDLTSATKIKSFLNNVEIPMTTGFYKLANIQPRGKCLIVNNDEVEGHKKRIGADKDVLCVQQTFTVFNYKIINISNKDIFETKKLILDEVNTFDSCQDSLVIFFMSHGSKKGIYGSKGYAKELDDLIESFYQSQSLLGIPKIVFVQACRGFFQYPTDSKEGDDPGASKILSKADVLISYATTEKDVCYRQENGGGSYFIQSLCSYFKMNGGGEDIRDVLKLVSNDVQEKVKEEIKRIQTPVFQSTLTKTFKFMEE